MPRSEVPQPPQNQPREKPVREKARETVKRLLNWGEVRQKKQIEAIADDIVWDIENETYKDLTDQELRGMTGEFKQRLREGQSINDLLPEAFGVVCEAASRVLGMTPHKNQIMGGIAMHFGMAVELDTGEGKTLMSTMPAYLNALTEEGVHIVTENDYLARRDAAWMGQVHTFLGLTVGILQPNKPLAEHKAAYAADITYGTAAEFGHDYERDCTAVNARDQMQRGHNFAIVDEIDSILIDGARTPLIISGPQVETDKRWVSAFARLVNRMKKGEDYEVDEVKKTVAVTEKGVLWLEEKLGIDNEYVYHAEPRAEEDIENLYVPKYTHLVGHLNTALKAKELYRRDFEYVVDEEASEALVLDEYTKRIAPGRRFREGIHQAIEAKEGLKIQDEREMLASITLQNYFRRYKKLAGMSATVQTEAGELNKVYKLGVIKIAPNTPSRRDDLPDRIYKSEEAKLQAMLQDIQERHRKGQPVLIGTVSIEKSEQLAERLRAIGITPAVLHAKNHPKEAEIIAQAGRRGAVTVATDMAGRGTDIILGGNPEYLARQQFDALVARGERYGDMDAVYQSMLAAARLRAMREAEFVKEAGGLYVLGAERHDSERRDNQLRGRSGRQGDPGQSRYYLSFDDEILKRFDPKRREAILAGFAHVADDGQLTSPRLLNNFKGAQHILEEQGAETRSEVYKFDEELNRQRQIIYTERQKILTSDPDALKEQIYHLITDVVAAKYTETRKTDAFLDAIKAMHVVTLSDDIRQQKPEALQEAVIQAFYDAYDSHSAAIEEEYGEDATIASERGILLHILDRKWIEQMEEMEYLKANIQNRAYANKDKFDEYNREGYRMYSEMISGFREEAVRALFKSIRSKNRITIVT